MREVTRCRLSTKIQVSFVLTSLFNYLLNRRLLETNNYFLRNA